MTVCKTSGEAWQNQLCRELAEDRLPSACRTVYAGRNRVLACNIDGFDGEVNIKVFRLPGAIKGAIYGWLRPGKARRSYEYSLRLLELGVATPRPYAYVEIYTPLHTLTRSYYVSEQLGPEWHEIRYMEERPDYEAMVEALGQWVARVHGVGVYVKDLSPGNILFCKRGGEFDFCMVDVNRMGFGCTDRRRQLYRAGWLMNSEESSADFARHYAAACGMDAAEAEGIVLGSYRRLQRRAARKLRNKKP